jgi:hypothetical protein
LHHAVGRTACVISMFNLCPLPRLFSLMQMTIGVWLEIDRIYVRKLGKHWKTFLRLLSAVNVIWNYLDSCIEHFFNTFHPRGVYILRGLSRQPSGRSINTPWFP